MPLILWLLGVPLGLVIILWLMGIVQVAGPLDEEALSERRSVIAMALVPGAKPGGPDQGPTQRASAGIDRALDRLSGKGPVEKAGERIDKAVAELKWGSAGRL